MVDLETREIVDKPTWKSEKTSKKDQIAYILDEINDINKGMEEEKRELEEKRAFLEEKESELNETVV